MSGSRRFDSLPKLTRAARTLALLVVELLSLSLASWAFFSFPDLPAYVRENDIKLHGREVILVNVGVSFILSGAVSVAILAWKRRAGFAVIERLVRRAAPATVVWLVPFLFDRRLWRDQELLVLPLGLAFAWGVVITLRVSLATDAAFPRLADRLAAFASNRLERARVLLNRPAVPLAVTVAGAASYVAYFSFLTILNHRNLGTRSFDLALEENLLWHAVRPGLPLFKSTPFSGPEGTHFGNHATFFAYAIAPVYWLFQRPETLLVVQSLLLGGAAIPLFLYARLRVPQWTAVAVAYAYLVYPPVHAANLYDFHYLPLGIFFLWLTLYAVVRDNRALAIAGIFLALSVREDVAACMAVIGAFLLLTGAAPRAGTVIAVVAGIYFVAMKMFIMPHFSGNAHSFLNQYDGLLPKVEGTAEDGGYGAVIKTLITNPPFAAGVLVERGKVVYLLHLLTPLLFLPLTRPVGVLLIVPGFFFTLLSTGYEPLYQPSFQYTSYWTAFLFIGLIAALEHAGEPRNEQDTGGAVRRRTLVGGVIAGSLLCTYLDGAILHRDEILAGFSRKTLRTTAEDLAKRATLETLLREIPRDGKVVASERLLPHVANRDNAYRMEHAIYDADWILFERDSHLQIQEGENLRISLEDESLGIIDVQGTMALARRGAPPTRNREILATLGRDEPRTAPAPPESEPRPTR